MVLSWITATNNHGRFVFSINKRRYTAAWLWSSFTLPPAACRSDSSSQQMSSSALPPTRFTLSVPVKGMEELVIAVGGVSGRWGDKFPETRRSDVAVDGASSNDGNVVVESVESLEGTADPVGETIHSERKGRSRRKRSRYPLGVPGLSAVALGTSSPPVTICHDGHASAWAVQGTVAHMECVVHDMITDSALVDGDHYLVSAQITRAFVRKSHWNVQKNHLQHQGNDALPILSFLGSQTFGYVE